MPQVRLFSLAHVMRIGLGFLFLFCSLPAWGQTKQPAAPAPTPQTPESAQPAAPEPEDPVSNIPLPEPKTVEVKGHKIVYYEQGQGSVVILLHGLGADSHHWAANIGPLSNSFHVIALDQIGYGKSDKPVMQYTVANFADIFMDLWWRSIFPKRAWWETRWAAGLRSISPSAIRIWWISLCWMPPDSTGEALHMPKGGWKDLTPLNTQWFFDLMQANKSWAATDGPWSPRFRTPREER